MDQELYDKCLRLVEDIREDFEAYPPKKVTYTLWETGRILVIEVDGRRKGVDYDFYSRYLKDDDKQKRTYAVIYDKKQLKKAMRFIKTKIL